MCAREVWPGHSLEKKKKRYCQEESDECWQEEMRVANEVQRGRSGVDSPERVHSGVGPGEGTMKRL